MRVKGLLQQGVKLLGDSFESARLDVELLLANVMRRSRAWLYAHSDDEVTASQQQAFHQQLARRERGEPVAYLLGRQEFYSLELTVTPDVLIPRPETECLVDWVLTRYATPTLDCVDLGTGSGAIAIALAQARPRWSMTATDCCSAALRVAAANAKRHGLAHIDFIESEWFAKLGAHPFDLIISNPPYIDPADPHLQQLQFEPQAALRAEKHGLAAIDTILQGAPDYLRDGGCIVLEHGHDQAQQVMDLLERYGYGSGQSHLDLAGIPRFVVATWH